MDIATSIEEVQEVTTSTGNTICNQKRFIGRYLNSKYGKANGSFLCVFAMTRPAMLLNRNNLLLCRFDVKALLPQCIIVGRDHFRSINCSN